MFDIKWIRDHPELFDGGLQKRGLAPLADKLIALDDERRKHVTKLQEAQTRRNAASKGIGTAKARKDETKAAALMKEVADLKAVIQQGEKEQRELEIRLDKELAEIPNLPLEDVPIGPDATANAVVRTVGTPPEFAFEPKQHFEIGEALGLMDFETAARISGSRFVVLTGALARLERALAAFMLDLHTGEFGYTEVNPPLLVRDDAMFGTAQLPKFEEDQFETGFTDEQMMALANNVMQNAVDSRTKEILAEKPKHFLDWIRAGKDPMSFDPWDMLRSEHDKLTKLAAEEFKKEYRRLQLDRRRWLIPTAEVPLTNLVCESIVDEKDLPLRVTAYTPCFRAEAGAAGKDTRGMLRQHQFSKVELVSITTPEQSTAEHERMTACAEEVLKRLGLAYRTVVLSTGDMGFAARKTYDIEVWLPGQNTYREISSCSVCGDFQARRMNARYRRRGGKDLRFVHTLNGSGLAIGRTLIAVLENYQQADGTVAVPDAVRPYMSGLERIGKAT